VGKQVQKTVPGAVSDYQPLVRYNTFADSNINFKVILRAEEYVAKYIITHEFIKRLHKAFKKEKIQIAYPTRTIYQGGKLKH
jgi:small-conductance mechanosensitive channel